MSTQSYKLLRVVEGRTYFAQVTVDVDATETSPAVVSAEAFAWLKDMYGPDAHEWAVCSEYREGALLGVEYALDHLGSPRPRPRVTVTRIEASPADTCRDAVAVAACHATWAALGDGGTSHPRITNAGIAFDNDDAIEVRRYGTTGPPLVVLHGGPGAPGSAAGLARALARDFQVFEPLQRRSGGVPLTVSGHVEDLRKVIQRPATLVGWSWGAMLGLSYAARYPEDVAALVLVGCGTYDESSRSLLRRSLEERLGETERRRIATLEERLAAESNAAARDVLFSELGAVYMKVESHELLEDTGDSADDLAADEAGYRETWNDVLRLQREGSEPDAFREISARVLMIRGVADPHPGEATRDLLSRFIPQLEYVELDRCGHEPWRERHARDGFLELVRSWLSPPEAAS